MLSAPSSMTHPSSVSHGPGGSDNSITNRSSMCRSERCFDMDDVLVIGVRSELMIVLVPGQGRCVSVDSSFAFN